MPSSQRPGMGAVPYEGGATFRVWAPFASAVSVKGTFNGAPAVVPLTWEECGYWSTDVAGVAVDDQYRFVITNPAANGGVSFEKNDPYARALTNSVGNSIVAESTYVWHADGYSGAV